MTGVFLGRGIWANPTGGGHLHARRIDALPRRMHIQPMLAIIILVAAGIGFYAFIGTAPKEAVQLMLFLFWGLLGLLTVGGIVYELIRAL